MFVWMRHRSVTRQSLVLLYRIRGRSPKPWLPPASLQRQWWRGIWPRRCKMVAINPSGEGDVAFEALAEEHAELP